MFFNVLLFTMGAGTINIVPTLWPQWVLCFLLLIVIVILYTNVSIFMKGIAYFILGLSLTQWHAWQLPWFDAHFYNKRVELDLKGYVASIPEKRERSIRFIFESEAGRFYLNWYGQFKLPKPGEYWHLKVRLLPVKSYENDAGFDMTHWLMLQAVRAKGYVLYDKNNKRILDTYYKKYPLLRYRFEKQQSIARTNMPHWQIISGLTLGLREAISDDVWQILRKTNTSHLLAISGLHIGMIAGIIFKFFQFFWRYIPAATTYIPANIAASIVSIFFAFLYALLAGWSIPTQRAWIMIVVTLLGIICRQSVLTWQGFTLSLVIVLCIQPLAIMTVGFALSFLAAFSLIYVLSQRRFVSMTWLKTQWAVTLFLLPWVLIFFKEFALLGWMVNFIAIPYVSFIVLPLCLIAVFLPFYQQQLLFGASISVEYLLKLLSYFSNLPVITWYNPNHAILLVLLATLGLLILMMPRGIPGRFFSSGFLLPLLLQASPSVPFASVHAHFLDVGHGLAVVVRTKHHNLIYDVGEPFMTRNVLLPFMQQQGIKKVHKVIISHLDFDHIGAINTVLFYYPQAILESSEWLHTQVETHLCEKNQRWTWDGVEFSYIHPDQKLFYQKRNNKSCVLRIQTGQQVLLLTGDIDRDVEFFLPKEAVTATTLLIPHHGSNTSSSVDFLKKVQPKQAILSTHQSHKILQKTWRRYENEKIKIWSTFELGQIDVYFNKKETTVKSYKERSNKKWYASKSKNS